MSERTARWTDVVLAVFIIGGVLWLRSMLCRWLLPDGAFLERLAARVQNGAEPVAEAVLADVLSWFE